MQITTKKGNGIDYIPKTITVEVVVETAEEEVALKKDLKKLRTLRGVGNGVYVIADLEDALDDYENYDNGQEISSNSYIL
jgi:hypothetical protein